MGGGGNNAAIAASKYGYRVKGSHAVHNSDSKGHDPNPILLYATVGYLIVAVLAVWPIVQLARRIKKGRKAQRKKALEDAARLPAAQRRRSSFVASGYNYEDDHSLAASTIRTGPSDTFVIAQARGDDDADDESVVTAPQDDTDYYPPQAAPAMNIDEEHLDDSVATPRRDNMDNAGASPAADRLVPAHEASGTPARAAEANAGPCDLANMELPSSPSIVTLGTIDTTPTIAEADAHMADVSIEMPPSMHRENESAAGRSGGGEDQHPMRVEGVAGENGQPFIPTAPSVASSKCTKKTAPTAASSFQIAPSKCSTSENSSHRTPSLNDKGTAHSLKASATQPTISTESNATSFNEMRISGSRSVSDGTMSTCVSKKAQSSVSVASKATRGTTASEANRSARSRATAATRMTTRSATTTSTVKSFHSLAGRGGRKALRAAQLANMRPDMAIPMPAPMPTPEAVSSSPYKAAKDDLTLKTVDAGDGATVGTAFTRRTATTAVTTATARSFYSLSARSGRKAITAARLATRAAITSPIALPLTCKKDQITRKANNSDDATVSMFDEYFSMEVGPLDEEEGGPRGCLIVCCADNDFNPDWLDDNVIDTEDVLDEGAWDNYEWHELPNHVRDAACLLGCTSSQAWNCGGVVYSNDKSWNELSSAQVKAARVLGFNQQLWDHEAIERTKLQQVVRGFDTYREVVKCDREAGMITSIAIPATWENMLSLCTGAVQVALISQYLGPDVLAAYAVVEGFLSVAYNIGSGLADAEEILVCQALGMEDAFLAGQYTLLSIVTYLLSAAPVYITLIFFIDEIVVGLRLGDEVAAIAMLYIPVLTLSHLVHDTFANTLSSLLRCSGKNVEMAIIDSIFNVLHLLLIAVAVTRLEFDLVGIAWVEVLSSVVYGVFIYVYSAAKGWLQPFWGGLTDVRVLASWKSIKNMMVLTIPLAWSEFLSSAEWSVLSLFAAWMGAVDLNAWTILGALWAIFEYAPEGIHTAVVMRLAFHLGHGDPRSAKVTGYRCLAYSGVLSLLISMLFYAWHKEIIALFTYNALTTTILEKNSLLIAVGNVIVSLGGTASVVLTAQGRPGTATWVYFIGVWGISIPLCAWFTFGLEYNTTGLVCAMLIAYTSASLVMLFYVFTTNWAKASMEAIAAEAEEEEYYGGEDDLSTIGPANLAHYGDYYGDDLSTIGPTSLVSKKDVDHCDPVSRTRRRMVEPSQDADASTIQDGTASSRKRSVVALPVFSSSTATHAASPLDVPMASSDDDYLTAYGMETTMSPSGLFTIVENQDDRFRQWVGSRPPNAKREKRRPPRAPKKGSDSIF